MLGSSGRCLSANPMTEEIRWYKGKYKVRIVKKSKGNYLVECIEIPLVFVENKESRIVKGDFKGTFNECHSINSMSVGDQFVTVPRLLWTHPRNRS